MELEIRFKNEFGEEFVTSRKVDEDWCDLDELEFLQSTYKNFLNNLSYALDDGDEVIILHDNEYVDTFCDGDCDNCDIDEDENIEDDFISVDEIISDVLKDHAKEIADLVSQEFNKAKSNTGFRPVMPV